MLKFPDEVQAHIAGIYARRRRDWLRDEIAPVQQEAQPWPLKISLGVPLEQEALRNVDAVRQWRDSWRQWRGVGQVFWCTRHWPSLGHQEVPEQLVLSSSSDAAAIAGTSEQWERARTRGRQLVSLWPDLSGQMSRHFQWLVECADTEFQRLIKILKWLVACPNSQLYPRQLPIAGVDSKWLERHQPIIASFISALQEQKMHARPDRGRGFYHICGLLPLPNTIRLRILDATIRHGLGGLGDIQAPWEQIAALKIAPKIVFIVENLQTGLAFTDYPGALVLMGLGYGVDVLGRLPWLTGAHCLYWGDLDTHGLAILNLARGYLQNLESVLMDEQTLLQNRDLWGSENVQHAAADLSLLTDGERHLYQGLKQNQWGQNLRLEQERIAWDVALEVLLSRTSRGANVLPSRALF